VSTLQLECCGVKSSWDWFQSRYEWAQYANVQTCFTNNNVWSVFLLLLLTIISWRGGNGDIGSNGTQEYLVPLSCCKKQFREKDVRCISTNDNIGIVQNLINVNTDIINDQVRCVLLKWIWHSIQHLLCVV
jgi:hypothetical protein